MLNSRILDVAIGLSVMYLFQSMLISGINDLLVAMFSVRGKVLKNFLKAAFKTRDSGNDLFEKFSGSPFISSLQNNNPFPAEITAQNFSDGVIELIVREDTGSDDMMTRIKRNVDVLPESDFKIIVTTRLYEAGDDYVKFKESLERWYDLYMARISRWYRKRVNYFMYVFSLATTAALNVDSFYVMNELWKNDRMRESVVVMSEDITRKEYDLMLTDTALSSGTQVDSALAKISHNYQNLYMLDFPITWAYAYQMQHGDGRKIRDLTFMEKLRWVSGQFTLEKVMGFLITTLAVSIGAPIWYDIIRKLTGTRAIIRSKKSAHT